MKKIVGNESWLIYNSKMSQSMTDNHNVNIENIKRRSVISNQLAARRRRNWRKPGEKLSESKKSTENGEKTL